MNRNTLKLTGSLIEEGIDKGLNEYPLLKL
ncbi:hypothetical protein J2S14_001455 [Lederbergia wuyishanensis]|uniref:Uncharacterized protein n=1 Tax=Lederbergia wuyishanensis TaxID=1347903 RepID=A0ABU0D2N2_9BACI|nr:hypothetical protein [Lederbergia wuyishanensis]